MTATVDMAAVATDGALKERSQRVLILGWNGRSANVVRELDQYLQPGSRVTVVADQAGVSDDIARRCGGLRNVALHFQEGNTTDRATLDALDLPSFDSVIVVCYSDTLEAQRADARTLVTLLHLRDMASRGGHVFSIVSEMMDDRNRQLAQVTKVDDVIVSEKVISLIAAQISENPDLAGVLGDILDADGSEIYLRPASHYLRLGSPVTFATVVAAAGRRGETALGFRVGAESQDSSRNYGVTLNPPKSRTFTPTEADRVIVLAEN